MTQRQAPYRATRKNKPTMHDLTPEKSLQEALRQAFLLYGWLYYHTYDSRENPAGFPDIIAVHPLTGRIIVWELKAEDKKVEKTQREWLDAFGLFSYFVGSFNGHNTALMEVDVVRPSDEDRALEIIQRWAKR